MASVPDVPPMAVYPVRTAPGYWFAAAMMFLLAGIGGGALVVVASTTGDVALTPGFAAVLAISVVVPVIYWLASPAYRIGGGQGAIRFFADRLEVPAASSRRPIVFPRDELRASSREIRAHDKVAGYAVKAIRRGHLVTLIAGSRRRALSTLTVERPAALLRDLERYMAGEAPLGPEPAPQ